MPAVTAEDARLLLRQMILIRRFEERCAELYSVRKIHGFLHLCVGQEAAAVGIMGSLQPGDAVVSTHREHGHALALGIPPGRIMAELFGRREGLCRGRGGSMHLFDVERRFYGGNAIVGGGLPLAVGLALADSMRRNPRVTVCAFGEGAVAEGVFHESVNLAALWSLPVLFCCENNRYAMGTALERSEAQIDLALKAAAHGVTARFVDGMDVIAVRDEARRAIAAVRSGAGPGFLEIETYRFRAHSMYDPERYRDTPEVDRWKRQDPIVGLADQCLHSGLLTADDRAAIEAEVHGEIDASVAFAEAGGFEPVDDLERFVDGSRSSGVEIRSTDVGISDSDGGTR